MLPLPSGAERRDEQRDGHQPVREAHVKLLEDEGACGGRLLIGIAGAPALPSEGDHAARATGSSNANVAPSPGADSTQMSPCIPSTSSRQM